MATKRYGDETIRRRNVRDETSLATKRSRRIVRDETTRSAESNAKIFGKRILKFRFQKIFSNSIKMRNQFKWKNSTHFCNKNSFCELALLKIIAFDSRKMCSSFLVLSRFLFYFFMLIHINNYINF